VSGFTLEEAERYYALVWNASPTKKDLENLKTLWDLERGNTWGICMSLNHVAHKGWETALAELREAPLPAPEGIAAEIHSPLYSTYGRCEPMQRKCFRALGALPQFQAYSLTTFAGLWNIPAAHATHFLYLFDADDHLVKPAPDTPDSWQIHPQVLRYASSLLALASDDEQAAARQWVERAAKSPDQRQRYEQLIEAASGYNVIELSRRRRITKPFITSSVVWRGIKHLWPYYSADWKAIQPLKSVFTSDEYLLANQLYRDEVRYNLIALALIASVFFGLVLIGVALGIADLARIPTAQANVLTGVLCISAALVFGLSAWRLLAENMRREVLWLELWEKVARSQQVSAVAASEDSPCE
jgi:hypothetical protein